MWSLYNNESGVYVSNRKKLLWLPGIPRKIRIARRVEGTLPTDDCYGAHPFLFSVYTRHYIFLGARPRSDLRTSVFEQVNYAPHHFGISGENMLMAEGYVNARSLASKFYGLYSLLRDLLSKQS